MKQKQSFVGSIFNGIGDAILSVVEASASRSLDKLQTRMLILYEHLIRQLAAASLFFLALLCGLAGIFLLLVEQLDVSTGIAALIIALCLFIIGLLIKQHGGKQWHARQAQL